MNRRILACLLLGLCIASGARANEAELQEADAIHELISGWRTPEARRRLEPLLASSPSNPALRLAHGRLLFFEGDYGAALKLLDTLVSDLEPSAPLSIKEFRDEVKATWKALKDFDEKRSEDGRFLVRFTGKDRILVPDVLDVLRRADEAFSTDFGFRPEGTIIVEIYPGIRYLSSVTPLSEEEIETSGTIALCKYNRLMVTSPQALVRGYQWRDTLAHEFVHYYLTRLSGNVVPIWLHEGIAKFQESRWNHAAAQPLNPPREDLLARSVKNGQLITFDQMHPSMAKLPSQRAAGLAFAEVHTVIEFLHRKKGYPGLRAFIAALVKKNCIPSAQSGCKREMSQALRGVFGFGLKGLWKAWKKDLQTRGLKTHPGLVQVSLKFKRPGSEEDEEELDYDSIEEKKAKDFAHLGELLRAKGRFKAALAEYRKAITVGGDGNPLIQNGAAAAMLNLGMENEVPDTLERVLRYYPDALKTHLNLGEAHLKLDNPELAINSFESASGINPFHPRPYAVLENLYRRMGRVKDADRVRKTVEMLR